MRIYLSVDMEGVAGVTHRHDVRVVPPHGEEHARARRWLTAETDSVVRAAFAAGADQVLVNDAHGDMRNLLLDELDPRADVVRGPVKPGLMMSGLTEDFDAAILLGYHARAGQDGVLSHTLNGRQLRELELDGAPIGEIGLSAHLAAELGIPVVLVSGDDRACAEASSLLGPGTATYETKTAVDRIAARCTSPRRSAEELGHAVARRLADGTAARLPERTGPAVLECTWANTTIAHVASWVPAVERTGGARTRLEAPTLRAAVDLLVVLLLAAEGLENA